MLPEACIRTSKAWHQHEHINEVSVFLCRVIINGIMMWWSSGQAATRNSHTPTWSRGTAPPASPGHFSDQRMLAWWDTITHPEKHIFPYTSFSPPALKIMFKGVNTKKTEFKFSYLYSFSMRVSVFIYVHVYSIHTFIDSSSFLV